MVLACRGGLSRMIRIRWLRHACSVVTVSVGICLGAQNDQSERGEAAAYLFNKMKNLKTVNLPGWWYVLFSALCCIEVGVLTVFGLVLMDKFPVFLGISRELSGADCVLLITVFLLLLLAIGIGIFMTALFVNGLRERFQERGRVPK